MGRYRYGFNGKENDNEVKGTGDQIDYGMRVYDPRVGRFLSRDPITKKYPELSPYQYASNTPIAAVDIDGLEGMAGPPPGQIYAANKDLYDDLLAGRNTPRVQSSRKAGGYIALSFALVFDAFVTKGWASGTLLGSQVFGAFPHNKASTPEGRAMQDQSSKEALTNAFIMWGGGKILGMTFEVGVSALRGLAEVRFNFAKKYYEFAGYSPERTIDHISGIDLTKEVLEKTYKKGTVLEQWRKVDKETGKLIPGDYYSLPGADPNKLGVDLTGRVKVSITLTKDTKFLQSTAADINDTWSNPGESRLVKGGEIQLFQRDVKGDVKQ